MALLHENELIMYKTDPCIGYASAHGLEALKYGTKNVIARCDWMCRCTNFEMKKENLGHCRVTDVSLIVSEKK